MAGVHALIGLGEAFITVLVIAAVDKAALAGFAGATPSASASRGEALAYALLIATGLLIFVSPFACRWPDGLDKAASLLGFEQKSLARPLIASPLAGYHIPGVSSPAAATVLAAAAGAAAVLCIFLIFMALARRLSGSRARPSGQG
jgi:hypothetical protein